MHSRQLVLDLRPKCLSLSFKWFSETDEITCHGRYTTRLDCILTFNIWSGKETTVTTKRPDKKTETQAYQNKRGQKCLVTYFFSQDFAEDKVHLGHELFDEVGAATGVSGFSAGRGWLIPGIEWTVQLASASSWFGKAFCDSLHYIPQRAVRFSATHKNCPLAKRIYMRQILNCNINQKFYGIASIETN